MEKKVKKDTISKVASKYILEIIFSYIDFNKAVKLIKYNNKFKKKFGIKKEDCSLTFKFTTLTMMEYFPYTPRKTYKFYRNIIFLINVIISIILIIIICFGFPEKEHLTENEKIKLKRINYYWVFYYYSIYLLYLYFFAYFAKLMKYAILL